MFIAVLVAACAQPGPAPKPDPAAEERAIRDQDARWLKAAQSRDAAGEAAIFADDGIEYHLHVEPLIGPAAFQAYEVKFFADNPKVSVMWTTDAVQVAASGDVAIQTGKVFQGG